MNEAADYYVTVHVHPHGEVQVFRWEELCSQETYWLSSDLVLHDVQDMTDEHLRDARAWLHEHADRVAETALAFMSDEWLEATGPPSVADVRESPLAEALKREAFARAIAAFADCVLEDEDLALGALEVVLASEETLPWGDDVEITFSAVLE